MADTSLPHPPHPLEQLTTAELVRYEAELRQTLRMVLDESLRSIVMRKMDEVSTQWAVRRNIRLGKLWPLHNLREVTSRCSLVRVGSVMRKGTLAATSPRI